MTLCRALPKYDHTGHLAKHWWPLLLQPSSRQESPQAQIPNTLDREHSVLGHSIWYYAQQTSFSSQCQLTSSSSAFSALIQVTLIRMPVPSNTQQFYRRIWLHHRVMRAAFHLLPKLLTSTRHTRSRQHEGVKIDRRFLVLLPTYDDQQK